MLRLNLRKEVLSFLEGLPAKQFKQITAKMFDLLRNPSPPDSVRLKDHPYSRVTVGEYRIVYRVEGDELMVAIIGKRNDNDVYRALKRLDPP